MRIPLLDIKKHHELIRGELDEALRHVLDDSAFAGGKYVDQFEKEFAEFCGTTRCVGVGSGTEALWLALLAAGIGPGDEVITSPMTFIATAEAISYAGATPVFVDIREEDFLIDPTKVETAITDRTKAVIPVHLYGQIAAMTPITEIGRKHGLVVIEDSAQAHAAEQNGKRAGSLGHMGCFSFYPGKNLGALGDAGAVTTDDEELAVKIERLRNHGQTRKYDHAMIGWNGRMDGFQGAALSVKLKRLEQSTRRRQQIARRYHDQLKGVDGLILPNEETIETSAHHIFSIRVGNRDKVIERLGANGIGTGIHYPEPVHETRAYAHLNYERGSLPVSEKLAREQLSLPMFPELTDAEVGEVVGTLKEALSN